MLFSKLGSYPKPETDGTEGWIEVPDAPEVPEGKELAWLNNEWVVRDPKPADRPGYQWNWAHGIGWVECEYAVTLMVDPSIDLSGALEGFSVGMASGPSMTSMPFVMLDGVSE